MSHDATNWAIKQRGLKPTASTTGAGGGGDRRPPRHARRIGMGAHGAALRCDFPHNRSVPAVDSSLRRAHRAGR